MRNLYIHRGVKIIKVGVTSIGFLVGEEGYLSFTVYHSCRMNGELAFTK